MCSRTFKNLSLSAAGYFPNSLASGFQSFLSRAIISINAHFRLQCTFMNRLTSFFNKPCTEAMEYHLKGTLPCSGTQECSYEANIDFCRHKLFS